MTSTAIVSPELSDAVPVTCAVVAAMEVPSAGEVIASAPDFCEPFVGWRVWLVADEGDELRLRSVVFSVPWPTREPMTASCLRRRVNVLPWRRQCVGVLGFTCGIRGANNTCAQLAVDRLRPIREFGLFAFFSLRKGHASPSLRTIVRRGTRGNRGRYIYNPDKMPDVPRL